MLTAAKGMGDISREKNNCCNNALRSINHGGMELKAYSTWATILYRHSSTSPCHLLSMICAIMRVEQGCQPCVVTIANAQPFQWKKGQSWTRNVLAMHSVTLYRLRVLMKNDRRVGPALLVFHPDGSEYDLESHPGRSSLRGNGRLYGKPSHT